MRAESAEQALENTALSPEGAGKPDARGRGMAGACKNRRETGTYRASAQTGTALAIIPIPIGCAPSPRISAVSGHGGARNSASHTSDHLTLAQARSLIEAALAARNIARPFNRHITVHWEAAGVPDCEAMAATTAFLKALREWAAGQTAYSWARENGDGKGSHLHILAHIPAGRKLSGARFRRWLERITGKPYRAGTIHTARIAGSREPDGPAYSANLQAVLAYVLKGAEPDAAAALCIGHEAGGRIIGKRCGTSRNIGAKARRRGVLQPLRAPAPARIPSERI